MKLTNLNYHHYHLHLHCLKLTLVYHTQITMKQIILCYYSLPVHSILYI
jgi:hypothetical protein